MSAVLRTLSSRPLHNSSSYSVSEVHGFEKIGDRHRGMIHLVMAGPPARALLKLSHLRLKLAERVQVLVPVPSKREHGPLGIPERK